MDHSTIAGVVAAAGLSSRMNAFKPLLRHGGTTIIESTVESLLASGAEQVFVVVGHQGRSIEALFRGHPRVRCVENPRYADGDMFASVRIGLSCAAAYDKVLFLPGDMPKPDAWSGYAYLTNHIRHAGDCVAMVAAESRELVDDALDAIEVEEPTNTGPYGTRGLGEPTACAVAPAIVNAIADATGCYVRSLPADLEKVLKAARSGIEDRG